MAAKQQQQQLQAQSSNNVKDGSAGNARVSTSITFDEILL